ncbi:MAG TPA: hypothetical protein VML01_12855 [Bryobacterales bacterium]|nr:hypothetical protein [Bryobacterales bacterium]
MNTKLNLASILFLLAAAVPVMAQTANTGSVVAVEHSVPFGTLTGKLLLLGDHLVFVDEHQLSASFVVPRSVIDTLSADGSAITVQTKEGVRNRSGEVTRLSFRVVPGHDPAVVTSWYGSGMGLASPAASVAPSAVSAAGTTTYQAVHNHTFGKCDGRFIIAADQVSYESVSSVSHSRRWQYRTIKEVKLSNPYELEIKPFSGGDYKLRFDGKGMDPGAYKQLVDRVTAARAKR